jgi:hypothetical protein
MEVSHIIDSVMTNINHLGINYTLEKDIQKYNESCLVTEDEKQLTDTTEEETPVEIEVVRDEKSEDSESEDEQEEEIPDISSLGIVKLKGIAKSMGIAGYTKYTCATKGELVKLINDRK